MREAVTQVRYLRTRWACRLMLADGSGSATNPPRGRTMTTPSPDELACAGNCSVRNSSRCRCPSRRSTRRAPRTHALASSQLRAVWHEVALARSLARRSRPPAPRTSARTPSRTSCSVRNASATGPRSLARRSRRRAEQTPALTPLPDVAPSRNMSATTKRSVRNVYAGRRVLDRSTTSRD